MGSQVTEIGNAAFAECPKLSSINLNGWLQTIGAQAFAGDTGLTEINISTGVSTIDKQAFLNCTGLKKIHFDAYSFRVPAISEDAFDNVEATVYLCGSLWSSSEMSQYGGTLQYTTHDYVPGEVVPPTCSQSGYTELTCSFCGDTNKGYYVSCLPHTEEADAAVEATCMEPGLTEGKHCSYYSQFDLHHVFVSFPLWRCFVPVNVAPLRLPPLSLARAKNLLKTLAHS